MIHTEQKRKKKKEKRRRTVPSLYNSIFYDEREKYMFSFARDPVFFPGLFTTVFSTQVENPDIKNHRKKRGPAPP